MSGGARSSEGGGTEADVKDKGDGKFTTTLKGSMGERINKALAKVEEKKRKRKRRRQEVKYHTYIILHGYISK